MVRFASLVALFLAMAFECSCQPTELTHCFGGSDNGIIGSAPGTLNDKSLKCFDAIGTNTSICTVTTMGFPSITEMFRWCLAGPPYINLLGCCATCANKISENRGADNNVSFALLNDVILAQNQICFNGIESTEFTLASTSIGCARLAVSTPSLCTPTTVNMCKFAFFNCRAYCQQENPNFGWC